MVDSPVRVLHVTNALSLGGTEKVMQLFVANLDRTRFTPAVYSPKDGIRARHIRALGISTFIEPYLQLALEQFRPHIVHLHRAGWPDPDMLIPLKRTGVPIVVETNVFGRHDPSHAASIIDHTLFVSHFCMERFAKTTGITPHPARHSVLYNPVDTDFFMAAACSERDFSRPVAGRISRADTGKWSRMALDFLPGVVRDIPDFKYHIIGAIPEALDYVRNNNLSANVIFHDPVETDREIATFLDNVSVLAHANDTGESFGLVIAEAMACGLPVITHPCEGLRDNAQLELVDHDATGLVAKTAEEYGQALKYLFSHPKEARRMGLAGQEKARRLYRAQTVARQLEAVYQELLDRKGIAT
ncbi:MULTISPECIES: glycosyltransferase family 4 protein [unclassified Pseudodesulfovibrio]|uniref:glycosyltransferase family 4 protein n=1 Tax=unclassified Pseudodesulfovibrio TaxID=2661612 RepID=UPI000FEB616A|nr:MULTISPECIES: glycosyltransferase family 4 protein [unclassified Pseudodesulfovibrio]MCJ2163117.1 glycosyltransferase family 4 protein [Pseudodesulfovibrio sp. S3-i]RWU07109.1 glycosyltransferase [Pseudodesulfovibrio sp. S3]